MLRTERGVLRLLSTVTTFGTAHDVTLAELSIEGFVPADEENRPPPQPLTADDSRPAGEPEGRSPSRVGRRGVGGAEPSRVNP